MPPTPRTKSLLFNTGRVRSQEEADSHEDVNLNNEFRLRFFIPHLKNADSSHLVIIINGFDEMNASPYHDEKKGICKLLYDRKIASVLLPIPNHMNRWSFDTPASDEFSPKNIVLAKPLRFYLGYDQLIEDKYRLARIVKGEIKENSTFDDGTDVAEYFNDETQIHLFGYSLGGLACLSSFLKGYIERVPLFDSCVLLASGANFQNLHPEKILRIDKKSWDSIKYFFYGQFQNQDEDDKSLTQEIFEMVILGEKRDRFHDCVRELSNRLLLIIGAKDEVSEPDSVYELEPEETGLAIIKIPGWGHPFQSPSWLFWRHWIISCASSFINKHPRRVNKDTLYKYIETKRYLKKIVIKFGNPQLEELKQKVEEIYERQLKEDG